MIPIGTGTAWVGTSPNKPQYAIVQMNMFPVVDILAILEPLLDNIRGGYNIHRNSYGTSTDLCNHIKINNSPIDTCGIMTLTIGFNQLSNPREYSPYEEIYMGIVTARNIPIHHMVYIEHVIEEKSYNIAIEHYIRPKSNTIHIFIDTTYERLTHLLKMRYMPRNIDVVY